MQPQSSMFGEFLTFITSRLFQETTYAKITGKIPFYVFVLHLTPVLAVVVIVALNLAGYWIGKELSGPYNSDGPKQLMLQLTAKAHEMLMLVSLSENLMSHILSNLVYGDGLPLGSFTSSTGFSNVSYLWSKEFRIMCSTKYQSRKLMVPLLLILVMLGSTVGPSSATALIPRLDEWPAGQAMVALNTSVDMLWPSQLSGSAYALSCNNSSLGCLNPMAWDSIGANLFSYWGHTTVGESIVPQRINVPSISSVRNLDLRLRGLSNSLIPSFSVVTVQHAGMADLVNRFRFLTFPSRSAKCKRTMSPAMCSYQDVAWSVDAMQPVVFAACREALLNTSIEFPVIDHTMNELPTAPVPVNLTLADMDGKQFQWVNLEDSKISNSSIGAVVRFSSNATEPNFSISACTFQAQWANATTTTRFSSTTYIVEGVPNGFDPGTIVEKEYHGSTVAIKPDWAQSAVESPSMHGSNETVFDAFIKRGAAEWSSAKLGTTIAVLLAEAMAHTGSGAVPLSIKSQDLALKAYKNMSTDGSFPAEVLQSDFRLWTTMTGYGYGLYTIDGLSTSGLISLIILIVYLMVTTVYLISLCSSSGSYIQACRHTKDVFGLCLNSQPEAFSTTINGMFLSDDTLKERVIIRGKEGQAELLSRWRDQPEQTI